MVKAGWVAQKHGLGRKARFLPMKFWLTMGEGGMGENMIFGRVTATGYFSMENKYIFVYIPSPPSQC